MKKSQLYGRSRWNQRPLSGDTRSLNRSGSSGSGAAAGADSKPSTGVAHVLGHWVPAESQAGPCPAPCCPMLAGANARSDNSLSPKRQPRHTLCLGCCIAALIRPHPQQAPCLLCWKHRGAAALAGAGCLCSFRVQGLWDAAAGPT